ncbi:MAG: sulfotransferase, partial [Planctomycetota bacterium]
MQPCFILGVPRSGTTLLRVLLGNHSQILGFPETPWIVGGYGPASLRRLCEDLVSDRTGPVATVSGISAEDVYTATREFLERLTQPALTEAGKRLPLFKTPNDAVNVDFLFRLYPNASYIHIVRDGRDVACSTAGAKRAAQLAPRLAEFGENNVVNAARRWAAWETAIRDQMAAAGGLRSIRLCYEDLVREPKPAISAVCDFLDIPYQETMIDPGATTADLPAWEAGSTDVRERPRIDSASVGRWVSTFTRREAAQI